MNSTLFLDRAAVRRAAGHRVICGLAHTDVDAELKDLLSELRPLGVILFSRDLESPEHAAELIRELKSLPEFRDDPLLVSVDQEGGRGARIRAPATEWPPMGDLGRLGAIGLTRRVGAALGAELRSIGIDIDYAPVLDVNTNPKTPVIGDRAFGADARTVSHHATAFLKGLNSAGVGGCGKHFPGHGDTEVDSHLALPKVEHELPVLREREWQPYREAFSAGLDAVMTAHIVVCALDENAPATLSSDALAPLRDELGFKGVLLSDDIEMKALADHFPVDEIVSRGIEAGLDAFLACDDYTVTMECYRNLVLRFEERAISHSMIDAQHRRVLAWRDRWTQGPKPVSLSQLGVHSALLEEIDERARAGV